jgi:hypothetical protein
VLEHVLLKVSALNDFYSTNIFDTYTVAKHIQRANIDNRLRIGDLSLVNELAQITIRDKPKNFYSFATKYCNHHYPDNFPIYDYYVEKMLTHYGKVDAFSAFHKTDLKCYDKFVKTIREFSRHYKLEQFSLREIDIFLWLAGRESFPRNYKRGAQPNFI